METEIELKFFVESEQSLTDDQVQSCLNKILDAYIDEGDVNSKTLINTYFDTPEQLLRQLDCGLRVRAVDGHIEQTIKTKGSAVGGLHKRPEYNVDIKSMRPELSLFPSKIWSDECCITNIQAALIPLFTTEFIRHRWLCRFQGSLIEVVLDLGEIEASQGKVNIREIELELKDGDVRQLCELAILLTEALPLRLSNDSKAARGYRLFLQHSFEAKKSLKRVKINSHDSVETAFSKTLQHGIEYWQYNEESFCNTQKLSTLKEMLKGIWLVRHALSIYQFAIPKSVCNKLKAELDWLIDEFSWLDTVLSLKQLTSKKANFRKKLALNKQFILFLEAQYEQQEQRQQTLALFSCKRYSQLIITIVKWMYENGWRCHSEVDEVELNKPIRKHVDILQQQSWRDLQTLMPVKQAFLSDDYIRVKVELGRCLLTGQCVGSFYGKEEWQNYRAPWIDILKGTDELSAYSTLNQVLAKYKGEGGEDLLSWSESKLSNLLFALEQSRKSAISRIPYWQV